MKNLSLFILCVSIAACQPSDSCSSWENGDVAYVYINDPDNLFSDEDLEQILSGCEEWSDATDNYITFEVVSSDDTGSLITFIPDSLENIQMETGHVAYTDWSLTERGGDITIPYDVKPAVFRPILLHEIGHALGLDHDHYGTIMYHTSTYTSEITCDDVCQFCEVNDCYCGDLPPCEKE